MKSYRNWELLKFDNRFFFQTKQKILSLRSSHCLARPAESENAAIGFLFGKMVLVPFQGNVFPLSVYICLVLGSVLKHSSVAGARINICHFSLQLNFL